MLYSFDNWTSRQGNDRTVFLSEFQFRICLDTAWIFTEGGGKGIWKVKVGARLDCVEKAKRWVGEVKYSQLGWQPVLMASHWDPLPAQGSRVLEQGDAYSWGWGSSNRKGRNKSWINGLQDDMAMEKKKRVHVFSVERRKDDET